MKSILKATICFLAFGPSIFACTDDLFTFLTNVVTFGTVPINTPFNVTIPAKATNYSGSNGNGAVRIVISSTGSVTINSSSNNAVFGNGGNFNFTLNLTPSGTGTQNGNLIFSPFCGTFAGTPVTLPFTYIGTGGSVPPTFDQNRQSGFFFEPVSTATGELFGHDEATDFNLGGPLPLSFNRYYASYLTANNVKSALGNNWMHNFDVKLAVTGNTATVTLFRGKTVTFARASSGSAWQLSSTEILPYQLATAGSGYQFMSPVANLVHTFDSSGVLTQIGDRKGNSLTVTQTPGGAGPSSVSDGTGRTLTFTYTGANLTRVQDQAGRSVSYEYTAGNLSAWTDANGKRSTFSYSTAGNLTGLMTTETRPAGNRAFSQQFDSQGRVTSQTEGLSNSMSLAYSSLGTTITEPLGFSLTDIHDAKLNRTSQTDPGGARSQFTYDANGRPTSITDRTGARTSATWDSASGRIASFTDELGNTTSFTYAAANQGPFTFHDLTSVRFADGTSMAWTYDANGNVASLTDQSGNKWQGTWNANGQISMLTNPSGAVTTFTYAADGTLTSVQADSGDTVALGYDTALRPNLVTNPDSTSASFQYDALDNVLRATDERNGATSIAFDDNNNLKSMTDPSGSVISLAYDADDRLSSATDSLGKATRQAYDAVSRVQSITNAAANSVTYTYDALNRPTSAVDASRKGLTFTWDQEARLATVTDPLSRMTFLGRDAHGRITTITTPNNEKYSLTYDRLGRLSSGTDALTRVTQLRYDPRGLLIGATLPGGITGALARNELGLITAATDPNGNTWKSSYDKMGRLTSTLDPLGRANSYQYDSRQRLASATMPLGTVQYSYDASGNLTTAKYSDGTTLSYVYDANGRLTKADGVTIGYDAAGRIISSNGLQMTRDEAGRITSITYAAGKVVRYSYDARGFLATVADWVGGTTAYTYDDAGELTSITYANGIREDYTYDKDGRIASLRATRGSTVLSSITVKRDALGRITSTDRSSPSIPDLPSSYMPLAYDAAGQSFASEYDAMGRVTSDALRTYSWDLAGRLMSYNGKDGAASFTYDALGQIVSRTAGGSVAGEQRIIGNQKETDVINYGVGFPFVSARGGDSPATTTYFIPGLNGSPLAGINAGDGTRFFFHPDESLNINFLSNNSGQVTDTYAYAPNGETVIHVGPTFNPYTYLGTLNVTQDGSTGLFVAGGQFFDSAPNRFLSPPPTFRTPIVPFGIRGGSTDPNSLGLWLYGAYAKGRLSAIPGLGQWGTYTAFYPLTFPVADPYRPFDSIPAPPNDIAPINLMPYLEKLFVGTTPQPGGEVLRRDLAQWVVRAQSDEAAITSYLNSTGGVFCSFADVCPPGSPGTGARVQTNPNGTPEWRYIEAMYRRGYTKGCADSGDAARRFCPGQPLTRGQMAVFIIRAKMNNVFPTSGAFTPPPVGDQFGLFNSSTPSISDIPDTHPYFEFIQKMRELRITSGATTSNFTPDSTLTRGQLTTFLIRAFFP